jgi:hypothetical protein
MSKNYVLSMNDIAYERHELRRSIASASFHCQRFFKKLKFCGQGDYPVLKAALSRCAYSNLKRRMLTFISKPMPIIMVRIDEPP